MTEEKGKAPGWLSSIISILVALLLLSMFPIMGNWIDKQRAGEGKYDFDEEMCLDINDEKQFDNTWKPSGALGIGAFMWRYNPLVTPPPNVLYHSNVTIMTTPINGTLDGYAVSTLRLVPGDVVSPGTNYMQFLLTLTKKDILDYDMTKLDVYIAVGGATFTTLKFILTDKSSTVDVFEETVYLGNKTRIQVEVSDILKINNLKDEQIKLRFEATGTDVLPGNTYVVLDMQLYCIREIKAPTLTRLAGWLAVMNTLILIAIFISFPQIQILGKFDSIAKRLEKLGGEGK